MDQYKEIHNPDPGCRYLIWHWCKVCHEAWTDAEYAKIAAGQRECCREEHNVIAQPTSQSVVKM